MDTDEPRDSRELTPIAGDDGLREIRKDLVSFQANLEKANDLVADIIDSISKKDLKTMTVNNRVDAVIALMSIIKDATKKVSKVPGVLQQFNITNPAGNGPEGKTKEQSNRELEEALIGYADAVSEEGLEK